MPSIGVPPALGPPDDSASEASVIELSWDEPDASAVLLNRYADDIHRYAARRLGTETADDLMAETFVIAFRQRRRYDVSRPQARSWLYGIVANLVGRHRRAEARRLKALARVATTRPAEVEPLAEPARRRSSRSRTGWPPRSVPRAPAPDWRAPSRRCPPGTGTCS